LVINELKKVWTNTAKAQLKAIYENYKVKSSQNAKSIKNEILQATKELYFAQQYQQDEIEPEYRRIIVRHYKLLYIVENEIVFIVSIFDTRQDPHKQKTAP
jgi:plasmid stabilization system protein ParE